jgi:hypothetical protein
MTRQHLRAETNAEKRLTGRKRFADPIDFDADPIFLVIGAHRAAKDYRRVVTVHIFGERIAETRPADVEPVTVFHQQPADPSRRRMFLMQNDQNPA